MGTHRNAAVTAWAVLLTVACSAPPSPDGSDRDVRSSANGAREELLSIYGRWRIVALNEATPRSIGSNPRSQPSIEFAQDRYRGSTGCNSFTGAGLLSEGRWFAETPLRTEQGCGDLTGQEEAVIGIVSGGPAVALTGRNAATLTAAKGVLRLRREGTPATLEPGKPPMLLAGTRWMLTGANGDWVNYTVQDSPARLTFEADEWTLDAPCARLTGVWRQEKGAVVLEAATEVARACRPALRAGSAAFARASSGRMRYVLGPEEIVLAGAGGWVQGHREPEPDAAAAALDGRWLVLSADGVPPPPGEQPAELAFGRGSFAVWDGCRHSDGVALIRARQLFTLGSGLVSMANCPPDPVRARIRAVVAASPRIARTREDGLALVSRNGTLRLDRRSAEQFGTGVAMTLRPGDQFDVAAGTRGTARLVLAPAERFALALPCGRLTGRWRNHRDRSGGYARFSPDPPPASCAADPAARRLERFFTGDVPAAIGPNKDIALFVNGGESLTGRIAP